MIYMAASQWKQLLEARSLTATEDVGNNSTWN